MKKYHLAAALFLGAAVFAGAACAAEPAKFHIGICTGTVSQSEDDLRGAEALIKKYGDVTDGGMIKHVTYPDSFMTEQETTISQIAAFADDPLMKAVIVNQGIPGTTEAFRRIREKRPEMLLFVGEAHEDPSVIDSISDLTVGNDNLSRGYLNIVLAKRLGCKHFVHISFPRHMSYELLSRRRMIMEQTCKDIGLGFHFETAPDPTSDVGVAGAQQFILEKMPTWIDKYGKDTAFFCTNDAQTEPMLKSIVEHGGYFIEADLPSPLMGYPGALGLDLADVSGNFEAILKRVEDTVVARGAGGRMGVWAYSLGFTTSKALGEFAIDCIEQGVTHQKFRRYFEIPKVVKFFDAESPNSSWKGRYYADAQTDVESKNHILILQDTYMLGAGPQHMTDIEVPEKYLKIH
ncbi:MULTISPECIES: DUF3798 domain-containing protein [unclassified Pyramidobacter]|uniref:DUF3798 domain-containing protein n=1 Tax=unclassified Pyramidobacter TaxID=2632171 RepID=UPI000EA2E3BF|nr:DUF3798 domain-containing protein [Pyramidobacter sp. CG50-2]RKJ81157.1 DUF3798 domain-containing protein [Pyramidobacter sp. CG50-2]